MSPYTDVYRLKGVSWMGEGGFIMGKAMRMMELYDRRHPHRLCYGT